MNVTARPNDNLITKKPSFDKLRMAMSKAEWPFRVLVCLATLVAFLFNTVCFDLAWAVGSPAVFKELDPATFTLPEYLSTIKDQWSPSKRDTYNEQRSSTSKTPTVITPRRKEYPR